MITILCCSILKREIEYIINKIDIEAELVYLDCTLHVDPQKLCSEINKFLSNSNNAFVIYGNKCCPDMEQIIEANNAILIGAQNCVDMILGPEVEKQSTLNKTFFLTGGWLENWKLIFQKTLKWDKIEARQKFGYCEKMLLIDNGLVKISDYELLEMFDYTGLPIETYVNGLGFFESLIVNKLSNYIYF
ncbi:Protein of unknown function [Desulfotomaculum arcticum]|uniref:DUF1638 domain-containing protein n=1 Tax=Desulfotruncus arcticus DSM 17038 TaxID=1121424 RepID=A0A1I2Q9U6_9FIRM|nr:DUF1638 domain-containing protein [Desulfotruncus arcticus]SFG24149.1 Protein of unknown function [Desulfotomaculum arcticum] [Desulfotruncus arcticus DSM 17038]